MHLNAVGGDCPGKTELHRAILARADARVVVEFEPQSRIEGEIQQMPADFPGDRVHPGAQRATSPGRRTRAARSRSSIRSASRSRTSRRCATCCACTRRSAAGSSRSTWCRIWRIRRTCSRLLGERAPRRGRACGCRHERRARGGAASARRPTSGAADRGASMGPEALRVAGTRGRAAGARPRGARPRQSQRTGQSLAAARRTATATCARGRALERAGARRRVRGAARGPAADSARRRPLPEHRFDQRGGAALPRGGQEAARPVARCARRLQHQRSSRRAATCTACRSPACAASARAS